MKSTAWYCVWTIKYKVWRAVIFDLFLHAVLLNEWADIVLKICMTTLASDPIMLPTEAECCPCYMTVSSQVPTANELSDCHSIVINIWKGILEY
jgi:hypothetical protein